jgi:hypothetical protein
MASPDEIRNTLNKLSLMETLISQSHVLNIPILPYELSTLMKEYRAETPTYNQIGNNAMVMFYSDEEKKNFQEFLRSKGVSFEDIGDATNAQGENKDTYTQSPVAARTPNKYGV